MAKIGEVSIQLVENLLVPERPKSLEYAILALMQKYEYAFMNDDTIFYLKMELDAMSKFYGKVINFERINDSHNIVLSSDEEIIMPTILTRTVIIEKNKIKQ